MLTTHRVHHNIAVTIIQVIHQRNRIKNAATKIALNLFEAKVVLCVAYNEPHLNGITTEKVKQKRAKGECRDVIDIVGCRQSILKNELDILWRQLHLSPCMSHICVFACN